MHPATDLPTEEDQPRQPSVCRFGHGPLNVKMEDGLGCSGAHFSQPPPAWITGTCRSTADGALAHEIDVCMVSIRGPMMLEVVKECRPVMRQAVLLKVRQRKRESVVDADQRRSVLRKPQHQPFGNPAARPVLACARRRSDLYGS